MSERAWDLYITDMLEVSRRVVLYTDGFDRERFVTGVLNYDATLRNLELIGEAANQLPETVRATMPQIQRATPSLARIALCSAGVSFF